MDGGVLSWIMSFVQAAISMLSQSDPSFGPTRQGSNTGSIAVQGNAAVSTSTSATSRLTIARKTQTADGTFGEISWGGDFVCYSGERTALMILSGVYQAKKDLSPRLGYICPHLKVPARDQLAGGDAGIRIHIANEPSQVEGCIEVGTQEDGDAVDYSKTAFDKLMSLTPDEFEVEITESF